MRKKDIPEYSVWKNMRRRCNSTSSSQYEWYGARGINVCERWDNFELFLKDMGNRPSRKHSIDRIDNTKGYFPDNCRWATHGAQCRNRGVRSDSKTKVSGVSPSDNGYIAQIKIDGNGFYLGYSLDFFEACCLRKSAENTIWGTV